MSIEYKQSIDSIFLRWIPMPGQGIVFATNTGLLKILR